MMNDLPGGLRRAMFLSLFGLIGMVVSIGFLSSGCDKKAPTNSKDIDSLPLLVDSADTAGDSDTLSGEPDTIFVLQIETTHNSLQGSHVLVDVTLDQYPHRMGGFDFMLAYDASALNFQAAIPGVFHTECGWEYFNYRYGPNGNCGDECPSGMLEVIAIAETNNGPNHPDMGCTDSIATNDPATLFTLDFLVSNDRTLECQFTPIRFFWTNCTDNSIAYHPSDDPMASIQGVSRYVLDFELVGHIENSRAGFPTYQGVQGECLVGGGLGKSAPVQIVDFQNGGVDIICADSIDAIGDINLNGTNDEIGDAVMFSNYFVHGVGVFNVNYVGQVAATDVNGNGLPLEVADLVYLIRIIVGDALPEPILNPVSGSYTYSGGVLAISPRAGAVFIVAEGNVIPTLMALQMQMSYAFDGVNTRILVSKIERGAYFEGDFLQLDANIVSVEFATYDGARINFDGGGAN